MFIVVIAVSFISCCQVSRSHYFWTTLEILLSSLTSFSMLTVMFRSMLAFNQEVGLRGKGGGWILKTGSSGT